MYPNGVEPSRSSGMERNSMARRVTVPSLISMRSMLRGYTGTGPSPSTSTSPSASSCSPAASLSSLTLRTLLRLYALTPMSVMEVISTRIGDPVRVKSSPVSRGRPVFLSMESARSDSRSWFSTCSIICGRWLATLRLYCSVTHS